MHKVYYLDCEVYCGNIKIYTDMIIKATNEYEAKEKALNYVHLNCGFEYGLRVTDVKYLSAMIFVE